jgi:hypothetical protein
MVRIAVRRGGREIKAPEREPQVCPRTRPKCSATVEAFRNNGTSVFGEVGKPYAHLVVWSSIRETAGAPTATRRVRDTLVEVFDGGALSASLDRTPFTIMWIVGYSKIVVSQRKMYIHRRNPWKPRLIVWTS